MTPNPLDPSLRGLDTCGCCEGTEVLTPRAIHPRPGLPAIPFRAGTHADFRATLLAGLSNAEWLRAQLVAAGLLPSGTTATPSLTELRTRTDDDLTIGLLDAFASLADVLTFYSERLANESFLRTATERRSVLWLARAIGYELKPGVAASTWLAFQVESAPGSPGWSEVPTATRVQSLPGPGERPQTYETLEGFEARKEWNELRPQSREFVTPFLGQTEIQLAGTSTSLKPGDTLLIVGQERAADPSREEWDFRRVQSVKAIPDADPTKARTLVALNQPLGTFVPRVVHPAKVHPKVFALRLRARLFGHGAPEWKTLPTEVANRFGPSPLPSTWPPDDWPDFTLHAVSGADPTKTKAAICLDATYPTIAKESWIVLSTTAYQETYRVTSVAESAPRKFTLTHQVTRLGLEEGKVPENLEAKFNTRLRDTAVFAQSEELPWAEVPFFRPVAGSRVTLDRHVDGLPEGRPLVFQGRRARLSTRSSTTINLDTGGSRRLPVGSVLSVLSAPDLSPTGTLDLATPRNWQVQTVDGTTGWINLPGKELEFLAADPNSESLVETNAIARTLTVDGRTQLELLTPLTHAYDPASLLIHGNVAFATHGESVAEILGQGDATRVHQQFRLRKAPLTFVPAANESGRLSSLAVWINGVRWSEVPSLYDQPADGRVFVTRRDDDGSTLLTFGDGRFGARLPSGRENISASYRQGIGLEGLVGPAQLSLLLSRPLGIKSVTNPAASSGAEDPENLDDARTNAPLQTLTLGRVVSLADYRDFSRAFAGVARAHAAWTWTPAGRGVFVSILGPNGVSLPEGPGTTLERLALSLLTTGNPLVPLTVKPGSLVPFRLAGTVHVAPDRLPEHVLDSVHDALKSAFGFPARDFGQPIAQSEVVSVIQNCAGVVFVDLDLFDLHQPTTPVRFIAAQRPRDGTALAQAQPAELLVLDESSLGALIAKSVAAS